VPYLSRQGRTIILGIVRLNDVTGQECVTPSKSVLTMYCVSVESHITRVTVYYQRARAACTHD